jgi:predicted CxxxxCH...CXXCH cytochrome family protein
VRRRVGVVLAGVAPAVLIAGAAGCSEARQPVSAACVTWPSDVAPLLAACTTCHGGVRPAAGYDLSTYLGALGGGSDEVPNAIAGDAGSRLLARLDGAATGGGDEVHRVPAATREVLGRWTMQCRLAALDTPLHLPGVLDPSSAQFHGVTVAAQGWDLTECARCHGDDFSGGSSGASCTGCHQGGPTGCQTCHSLDAAVAPRGTQGGARPYGAGALDGAHRRHAAIGLACAECHRVPEDWSDEGHVRRNGAADEPPAELDFATAARRGGAEPSYADGRCSGVYCHGATLRDGGATVTTPAWRGGPAEAACGTCHGAPPASHADDRCATCHPAATARHLDGVTTIGRSAGCDGCHGDASSPAPPRDLSGATAITALGVGAHRAHLDGPRRLRGPIACAACHRVPAAVGEVGHIDSAAPAEVDAGLGWDRAAESCATAWCHGPARPRWTSSGQVTCGTCHGIPPADADHAPDLPLTACAGCHPRSVDAFGNILFSNGPSGPTSEHLDGDVDLP